MAIPGLEMEMEMEMEMKMKMKMKMVDPEEPPSSSSATSANFALVKRSKRSEKKQLAASKSTASAKFMSVVPDELLLQIFLRLPNGRTVIQCATVCKSWYSLIINPHSRKFIGSFIQYHLRKQSLDSSYYPAYTNTSILFNVTDEFEAGPYFQFSSKVKETKPIDISFLPYSKELLQWEELLIRASSGYLLLVSRDVSHYYICNSLTREWLALPEVFFREGDFLTGTNGFALLCDPVDVVEDQGRYRYKVVIINNCLFVPNTYSCCAAIFDSETGMWTQPNFPPAPCSLDLQPHEVLNSYNIVEIVVAGNGILHWLDGLMRGCGGMFVFDPLRVELRRVLLPSEQFSRINPNSGRCNSRINRKCGRCKVRLGVVQGRIRLSLMEEIGNQGHCRFYSLKVWELDSNWSWLLVHDIVLEGTNHPAVFLFVLAFDHEDGNVLFLVHGTKPKRHQIFQYTIDQNKYMKKKICKFPRNHLILDAHEELKVSTVVPPLWPTLTLSLSSTKRS